MDRKCEYRFDCQLNIKYIKIQVRRDIFYCQNRGFRYCSILKFYIEHIIKIYKNQTFARIRICNLKKIAIIRNQQLL